MTNTTDRVVVEMVSRLDAPKKFEWAVKLDGEIVRREGGSAREDYTHAAGFAMGLRLGLSKAGA